MANLSNINDKFLVTTGGNVLIGQTAAVGTSKLQVTGSGDTVAKFNRLSSDGEIIRFEQDNGTDGAINSLSGRIAIGSSTIGIFFDSIRDVVTPHNMTTNTYSANISLGRDLIRFKDLYLSGIANIAGSVTAGDYRSPSGDTLYITSGLDWRFRETGGAEKMRIDSSGRVGIAITPSAWSVDALQVGQASISQDVNSVYVGANTYNSAAGWKRINAQLAGYMRMGTNDGIWSFSNGVTGVADSVITWNERMRIDADGNVGIGTTDPTSQLFVSNTVDGDKIRWGRSAYPSISVLVGSLGTYNGVPYIGYQGGAGGGIMFNGSSIEPTALGSARSSATNDIGSSSYKWRNIYLSGGAYLGGTGSANHLDDYEEGTWNISITSAGGNMTNIAFANKKYTKIGNLVTYSFDLSGSFTSAATESSVGFSLPFTAHSSSYKSVGIVSFVIGAAPNRFGVGTAFLGTTSATMGFIYIAGREVQQSGAWGNMRVTASYFTA